MVKKKKPIDPLRASSKTNDEIIEISEFEQVKEHKYRTWKYWTANLRGQWCVYKNDEGVFFLLFPNKDTREDARQLGEKTLDSYIKTLTYVQRGV